MRPRTIQETPAEAETLGLFPRAALRIREVAARNTSSAADMEEAICLTPQVLWLADQVATAAEMGVPIDVLFRQVQDAVASDDALAA